MSEDQEIERLRKLVAFIKDNPELAYVSEDAKLLLIGDLVAAALKLLSGILEDRFKGPKP